MSGSLVSWIPRFSGRRVAVIGDVMLDHFVVGGVERISPEAPVPIVHFEREEFRLGGAANVAANVRRLDGRPTIVGIVGGDPWHEELNRQLERESLGDVRLVVDERRPTTRKVRIVTPRNQQVARVDHERDDQAEGSVLEVLLQRVRETTEAADAVVLSDYRKGVVTPAVISAAVAAAAGRRIPVLVDPKVVQVDRYRNTTLITPNHHEAELMTHASIRTTDDARQAARRLHEQTGASILITWGEHGMWVLDASGTSPVEASLPAATREVADVTGAGDTVIAVLALAVSAGAPLLDAAHLANSAAGLVVGRFGPASVTPDELAAAIAATG